LKEEMFIKNYNKHKDLKVLINSRAYIGIVKSKYNAKIKKLRKISSI